MEEHNDKRTAERAHGEDRSHRIGMRQPRRLSRGARVSLAAVSLSSVLTGAVAMAMTADQTGNTDGPDEEAAAPRSIPVTGSRNAGTVNRPSNELLPDCPPWEEGSQPDLRAQDLPAESWPSHATPPGHEEDDDREGGREDDWHEDDNHEDHEEENHGDEEHDEREEREQDGDAAWEDAVKVPTLSLLTHRLRSFEPQPCASDDFDQRVITAFPGSDGAMGAVAPPQMPFGQEAPQSQGNHSKSGRS